MPQNERDNEIFNVYTGAHKEKLDSQFGVYSKRLEVLEEKYILPPSYKHWYHKYKEFKARPTDIWVISFPRSETTWTQEMVWCVQNGLNSKDSGEILMKRFPFFEFDSLISDGESPNDDLEESDPHNPGETWKISHSMKDPRTIKSHQSFELLPDTIFSSSAKVGDWKSHFTAENKEEFRKWTMEYLKGTDFPLYRDYD